MQLGSEEQILREWQYANTKFNIHRTNYSLTVTDKRIISASSSKVSVTRQEMLTSQVCGVDMVCAKQSLVKAILLLVFGFLCASGGFLAMVILPLAIALFVVAALLIGIGVWLLLTASHRFEVKIYSTARFVNPIAISCNGKKKKTPGKTIRLKVDKVVGQEIVECLGAMLLGEK